MKYSIKNVMLQKENLEYINGYISVDTKCNWKCKNHPDIKICLTVRNLITSKVSGCPICNREKESYHRSFAFHYPEMLKEWDYEKNDVNPKIISKHSCKEVYWKCDKNHSFLQAINSRACREYKCPYCTNKRVLKGFNDLWTTHPHIAEFLENPNDGYEYTYGSTVKLNFKCKDCGCVKNATISDIVKNGFKCPCCSDGFSYPEKVMYNFLSLCGIQFDYHARKNILKWNDKYEYDFYLPNENKIIETHGNQHYEDTVDFEIKLKEQLDIDKSKRELAIKNGIEEYIVIDCRRSNIGFIKNNILKSDFLYGISIHKNIDWNQIDTLAQKSLVKKVCDFYQYTKGTMTFEMIGKCFNLHKGTIKKYIITGTKLGFCDYDETIQRKIGHIISNRKYSKNVYCINTNQVFENSNVAGEYYNVIPSDIRSICNNKKWRKTAGKHPDTGEGLMWTYNVPKNFDENDIIYHKGF